MSTPSGGTSSMIKLYTLLKKYI